MCQDFPVGPMVLQRPGSLLQRVIKGLLIRRQEEVYVRDPDRNDWIFTQSTSDPSLLNTTRRQSVDSSVPFYQQGQLTLRNTTRRQSVDGSVPF
jgi:hypothetical protein